MDSMKSISILFGTLLLIILAVFAWGIFEVHKTFKIEEHDFQQLAKEYQKERESKEKAIISKLGKEAVVSQFLSNGDVIAAKDHQNYLISFATDDKISEVEKVSPQVVKTLESQEKNKDFEESMYGATYSTPIFTPIFFPMSALR